MAAQLCTYPSWNEEDRLRALNSYEILDTPVESDFEDIVKMAASVCRAPVSVINLIAGDRQWFKAEVGLGVRETPLDISICAKAILQPGIFTVPDLSQDARFEHNPLITGDPGLRFYAGALLETPEGLPLGTMCVLDFKPRTLTTQEGETLKALARQVMTLLELRRALNAKSRSEERLNLALEASGFVGVWEWDIVKDRVYADHRFISAFGGEPSWSTEGAPIAEYVKAIHPKDVARVSAAIEQAMHPEESFQQEYRLVQKDGSSLWIEARGKCHFNESGKAIRFPGVAVDITERRLTQARTEFLSQLTQKLSLLSSPEELNLVATREVGHFLEGNRCYFFEAIPPYLSCRVLPDWHMPEVKSLMGTYDLAVFGEPEMWETLRTTSVCIDDSSHHPWTKRFLENYQAMDIGAAWIAPFCRDGKWVTCLGVSSYHSRQWKPEDQQFLENVMLRVWPLIERARIDLKLREAHTLLADKAVQLESLVQERTLNLSETIAELEAFSYSISHDMRAPLRSMIHFAEMLKEDCGPMLDATGVDYLNRISQASRRMDQLIQDVLVLSRVSREEVTLERIDADALIRDIIETYPNLHQDKVHITVRSLLPPVLGNAALLTQCFSNLLDNGAKFAKEGALGNLLVWTEKSGDRVRIYFQDDGIGMPEHSLERIFEIFQRVGRTGQGTGIGLAIVRKAVEKMGGTVGVKTKLGEGSLFWLDLRPA